MYLLTLIIPGYDLKVYVDKTSFAIYRLEFGWGDGEIPILTYKKNRNLENNVMRLDKIIEFEPFEGTYYLKYIRSNYKNKWVNLTTDSVETTTELYQELLINKVDSQDPQWVKSSQKMKKYGLQFQNRPYNEEFWRNYNVIKSTPLDQSILRDLESEATLETQFKNN